MKESISNQLENSLSGINPPEDFKAYSEQDKENIINYIFRRVESGMSYFDAVKSPFEPDKDLISSSTFHAWITANVSWSNEYSRVSAVRHDRLAEDTIKIADTPLLGIKTVESEKGIFTTKYDNTDRSRLMIGARQWFVGKVASNKYGNNAGADNAGADTEQPLFNDIG